MPYPVDLNPEINHSGALPQRFLRGYKVFIGLSDDDDGIRTDAMLFSVTEIIEHNSRMPPIEQIELYDKFIIFRHPNLTKIYAYEAG